MRTPFPGKDVAQRQDGPAISTPARPPEGRASFPGKDVAQRQDGLAISKPGRPRLTLVVAYARNRVIGRDNDLPWKLPGDLAHFKRTTLGHPIVMGRKTWESLGRPLPGRTNIVITRNADYAAPGAVVVPDIDAALTAAGATDEVFIIGGAQIFGAVLDHADRIIATEIKADVDGDAWFPLLPSFRWREVSRQPQPAENGYEYDFVVYERVPA